MESQPEHPLVTIRDLLRRAQKALEAERAKEDSPELKHVADDIATALLWLRNHGHGGRWKD
jgi:hypothetical protein